MTYKVLYTCKNCGEENQFEVEDKILVKDHLRLKAEKCKNCNFRL